MTTKAQYRVRMMALATIGIASLAVTAAETPVSIVNAACPAIPLSRTVTVATTQTMVLGQSIVLAVAVDSADAPDLVVSGPAGLSWSTLGGHKSEARHRSVMLLRGRATGTVAAGGNILLNFALVESGRSVCVRGMRYSSFIDGTFAITTDGQDIGLAAETPAVSGKVNVAGAMGVAAFEFSANPGALTPGAGTITDGGVCNGAQTLCLQAAHRGDINGAASISLTPVTASDWQATMAVLIAPGLFKDGFE